ncbi:MAG: mandelate racemase/muconate lactonizing enzyme family protein [Candidatus Bathyarchaeota archaeon]|nr:MAG: mandelate racemase/muconate lactonizing enzyme family protein [Candidatus Bathyarchaeota archaeon]
MKITDVKTFIVGTKKENLRRPHRGGLNWIFLKLLTDEGIHGWGECSAMPRYREHTCVQLIKELGKHFIVNKMNPFDIEKLWDKLYGGTAVFRHPGTLSTQIVGAYEMACWDIIGKALNQPIYNLLGGKFNEKLRSYTYLSMVSDAWLPGDLAEEAGPKVAKLVKQGFTGVKLDPIPPSVPQPREISLSELDYSEAVIKSIREAVGNKCDILIGTHGQLTTHSAIRLAKRLEKYEPLWFEEPVPGENMDEMARVARATSIPIATGERLATKWDFRRLLEKQAAQIIQISVGLNGILEAKKIAGMAEAYYAQIAPWMYCGPVAGVANIQLDVCSPNFLIQEGIETWGGFYAEILKEPIRWEKGYIIPPTGPGLGVELDEAVIADNPYIDPSTI